MFLIDTNTSHRGLGTIGSQGGTNSGGFRLVDTGGIHLRGGIRPPNLPTNAVYRPANGKWYFVTLTEMTWSNAETFAEQHGGTLVAIEDASENDFVKGLNTNSLWIGLNRINDPGKWIWTSGSLSSYTNWLPGSPNDKLNRELCVVLHQPDGQWDDAAGG